MDLAYRLLRSACISRLLLSVEVMTEDIMEMGEQELRQLESYLPV